MGDLSRFWRNEVFHDATMLLSSDSVLLENRRSELQETLDLSVSECDTCRHNPKRRKKPSDIDSSPPQPIVESSNSSPQTLNDAVTPSSTDECMRGRTDLAVAAATTIPGQVLTLPVHKVILSTGSDYFNTAILTLIGEEGVADVNSRLGRTLHPIIVVHEEDVEAAQAVLEFIYTKTLRNVEITASRMMKLLMIADRWVVPACVVACCKIIAALSVSDLTLQDVLAIYSPSNGPTPTSLLNHPEFKPVLEMALFKLLDLFGNVPAIVASTTLTAQLLQLPHAALLALLSSDTLTTDSEDSVLMLLSWWLEDGTGKGRICDAVQLAELTDVIRYCQLSASYLAQAFSFAPRLSPSPSQLSELNHFHSFTPAQAVMYGTGSKSSCPAGWFKPQRTLTDGKMGNTASVTLSISTEQLSQRLTLARSLEEGVAHPAKLSAVVDYKGLAFTLEFSASKREAGETLKFWTGTRICVRLPACSSAEVLRYGIPSSFSISIHRNLPNTPPYKLTLATRFHSIDWGWNDFAYQASKLPGDPLLLSWWDPFIIDGHVKLTADLVDQRKGSV